jgi:protein phosphatase
MHPKILSAGLSDVGQKRENNQDHFLIADLHRSLLLLSSNLSLQCPMRVHGDGEARLMLVADGMGGHQAGGRASVRALELCIDQFLGSMPPSDLADNHQRKKLEQFLHELFHRSHRSLESDARSDIRLQGMGTTLTIALLQWPRLLIAHAGDSRCYLLRNGLLTPQTQDHTIASELVARGELNIDDAPRSPWGNMLWNVLGGGGSQAKPDIKFIELQADDRILLCSDGLNKHLTDNEIAEILLNNQLPEDACRCLVELANRRGGTDNITVVISQLAQEAKFTDSEITSVYEMSSESKTSTWSQTLDYLPDSTTDTPP